MSIILISSIIGIVLLLTLMSLAIWKICQRYKRKGNEAQNGSEEETPINFSGQSFDEFSMDKNKKSKIPRSQSGPIETKSTSSSVVSLNHSGKKMTRQDVAIAINTALNRELSYKMPSNSYSNIPDQTETSIKQNDEQNCLMKKWQQKRLEEIRIENEKLKLLLKK